MAPASPKIYGNIGKIGAGEYTSFAETGYDVGNVNIASDSDAIYDKSNIEL